MTPGRRRSVRRRPGVTAPGRDQLAAQARIDALVAAFTQLGPAWHLWTNACAPPESVSYIRMRLLRALDLGDRLTMTEVSQALGVTQRRVTALVDALTDDGLVVRHPNPADRRSALLQLTETGREQQRLTWRQHQNAIGAVFADLPAELQKQLLVITPLLIDALRRRTADQG